MLTRTGTPASDDSCLRAEVAFVEAWIATLDDYRNKRVNSEACLQSALYSKLVFKLPPQTGFRVFVEASIRVAGLDRYFGDIVICHEKLVVAAVELKYKPKADPKKIAITADLKKLVILRNYKDKAKRVEIVLRRFQGKTKEDVESFTFAPSRRLIFGVYCSCNIAMLDNFWQDYCPKPDDSKRIGPFPPKLMICIAHTGRGYAVAPEVFGGKIIQSKIGFIDPELLAQS